MRVEKLQKKENQTNQSSPNIGPNLGSCHVSNKS